MPFAYIKDDKIIGSGGCNIIDNEITCIEISEEVLNKIEAYMYENGVIVINPNYEQEKAKKERLRLDALTLTPSDVERALYYGLGMDFDDLKALIQEQAPTIDMKGLAIEFRANNFYRGAVDRNGNRIIDMVGLLLGYNSDDMDYLFKNKKLPIKEV